MKRLLLASASVLALAQSARADVDQEQFGGYHKFICRPTLPCTIPPDWNNNYNIVYLVGGSGDGSAGVANTHTGLPGGSAAFALKKNMPLIPGTLVVGAGYRLTHDDQTPSFIKDALGITHQLDYGRNAVATVSGNGALCSNSFGWDLCHNGATTDYTRCNVGQTRRGGPGAPGDASLLMDGWAGGCERDLLVSHGGGGAGMGPYGVIGGDATATNGGKGGNGMDGLLGPTGGASGVPALPAVDAEGGAGPFAADDGHQDANPGNCLTWLTSDTGDQAQLCGGASGPAGGSITNPGHCANPSGGGADTAGFGTPGCKGHDAYLAFMYSPHPIAIAGTTFSGFPINTGGPELVDYSLVPANLFGSVSGTTLTVTTVRSGLVWPGMALSYGSGSSLIKTTVVSQLSGIRGGIGTYQLPATTGDAPAGTSFDGPGWPDNTVTTTVLNACPTRNPTTHICSGPFLTLGFNAGAGGVSDCISFIGNCARQNYSNDNYGSTSGDAGRDNAYGGTDNLTAHGCGLTCGAQIAPAFITTTPTSVSVDPYEGLNFGTPDFRWNHFQNLTINNQCGPTDPPCAFGDTGHANAPGTVAAPFSFTNESQEYRSGWHQSDYCEDKSKSFAGNTTVPVVKCTYLDIYDDDTPTGQFSDPRNQFTDGTGRLVLDPSKFVLHLTLPNGPTAKIPDFSVWSHGKNIHLDANVFTSLFYTVNGQWQMIPLSAGGKQKNFESGFGPAWNQNYHYNAPNHPVVGNPNISYAAPPDGGLVILSDSPNPNGGDAAALWAAEDGPNCDLNCAGHVLLVKADGTYITQNNLVQCQILEKVGTSPNHTIPSSQVITDICIESGIISPTNLPKDYPGDCPTPTSCREGYVTQRFILGGQGVTPNMIRKVALGAPGS